jgi:RHS repeat-associated protein
MGSGDGLGNKASIDDQGMGAAAGLEPGSLPERQGMGDGAGLEPEGAVDGQGVGGGGAGPGVSASPESQDKRHGAIQSTLGYAGMFYHVRSGLYLTHYRAYDPRLGRWLSRDPLGDGLDLHAYLSSNAMAFDGTIPTDAIEPDGGQNAYLYANANPLWFVDPTGLNPVAGCLLGLEFGPIGCGIGAIGGETLAIIALMTIPGNTAQQCRDNHPCPPCTPYPKNTVGYEGPHTTHTHWPIMQGPHLHIWVVNQDKTTCKCWWNKPKNKIDRAVSPPPLPGWVDVNGGLPALSP